MFFQRLIQQSGLQVQESFAPAPLVTNPGVVPSPASNTPVALPELFEIHEERVVPAANFIPAIPPHPERSSSADFNPLQAQESIDSTRVSNPQFDPPGQVAPQKVVEITRQIEAISPASLPKSLQPSPIPKSTAAALEKLPRGATAEKFAQQEGIPSEVMEAVMRWIAAGQTQQNSPQRTNSPASAKTPQDSHDVTEIVSSAELRSTPPAPSAIPDRVIEMVEEHFETVVTPPIPPPFSEIRPPQVAASGVPEITSIPTADPVRVSIGSINVRIEAPPTAPSPARVARTEPSRPATSARSSNFSKLRRHYILPH